MRLCAEFRPFLDYPIHEDVCEGWSSGRAYRYSIYLVIRVTIEIAGKAFCRSN